VLHYHGISDTGCVRADNEDRILMDGKLGVFVVADGMGGHRHGELAAELAISTLRYYLDSSRNLRESTWPYGYNFNLSLEANRLVTGILLANRQIWARAADAPEYAGMGSTIAAVLINENRAAIANVGDSRGYLFRDETLSQLTIDDTWLNSVLRGNDITEEAKQNHPMRDVLTQAAGSQNDLEVHTVDIDLRRNDMLLLCSDGLSDMISEEGIRSALQSNEALPQKVTRLCEAARSGGAPDNISCILLRYEPDRPAPDRPAPDR
jgi:serine/threonine protein phosphatase PrpC